MLSLNTKFKRKNKKTKPKKVKTQKTWYYYYPNDSNTPNQDSAINHSTTYKNIDNRLYNEVLRYYGKSYAMGRSKQDLIDDYMNEK